MRRAIVEIACHQCVSRAVHCHESEVDLHPLPRRCSANELLCIAPRPFGLD